MYLLLLKKIVNNFYEIKITGTSSNNQILKWLWVWFEEKKWDILNVKNYNLVAIKSQGVASKTSQSTNKNMV